MREIYNNLYNQDPVNDYVTVEPIQLSASSVLSINSNFLLILDELKNVTSLLGNIQRRLDTLPIQVTDHLLDKNVLASVKSTMSAIHDQIDLAAQSANVEADFDPLMDYEKLLSMNNNSDNMSNDEMPTADSSSPCSWLNDTINGSKNTSEHSVPSFDDKTLNPKLSIVPSVYKKNYIGSARPSLTGGSIEEKHATASSCSSSIYSHWENRFKSSTKSLTSPNECGKDRFSSFTSSSCQAPTQMHFVYRSPISNEASQSPSPVASQTTATNKASSLVPILLPYDSKIDLNVWLK